MSIETFIRTYHNPNSLYINQQEKWLWLRIHKTAGTSMYDAFLKDHCINIAKQHQAQQARTWINTVTSEQLEQYTIWTCVRNPYSRFNSMAAMFKKEPNRFAKQFFNLREQNRVIKRHTEPQHTFTHINGDQLPNYIIYFERLQEGFTVLCNHLGLPKFTLPQLNASRPHATWQQSFNQETIHFVNTHFAKDFEYFNYKKL